MTTPMAFEHIPDVVALQDKVRTMIEAEITPEFLCGLVASEGWRRRRTPSAAGSLATRC